MYLGVNLSCYNISMYKRGFTLIELLVTISIISLLSSVVLSSVNGARMKAEGRAEGSRARQYVFAIESYVNDTGMLPSFEPGNAFNSYCMGSSAVCSGNSDGSAQISYYVIIDNIVLKYVLNVKDVNFNELKIYWAPDEYSYRRSAWYQCQDSNDSGCTWGAIFWYTRGKGCGVENATESYYDFADATFCVYEIKLN
jgi:prepilin-type N-terminal cleavage/methylation domain-containing protein